MFESRFLPCPECGASVERSELELHACDEERRLDYLVFQLRGELEAFEEQLGCYLRSARGRFELWYAARRRAKLA
jgi:hypothetical protein